MTFDKCVQKNQIKSMIKVQPARLMIPYRGSEIHKIQEVKEDEASIARPDSKDQRDRRPR